MSSQKTWMDIGKDLMRVVEGLSILTIAVGIFWYFASNLISQYERLAQNLSPLEAVGSLLKQAVPALLIWGGLSIICTGLAALSRRRAYQPQAGDNVLFRNDDPGKPAIVLREDRLLLFRSIRPDVLKRSELCDCEIREEKDGMVFRVHNRQGNVWNYHWIIEEGEVDMPTLRQWVNDWLAWERPSWRAPKNLCI